MPLKKPLLNRRGNSTTRFKIPQPPMRSDYSSVAALKDIGLNKDLIIVGNGPSKASVPLELLKDYDIISVNRPDLRIWPTKYWVLCDKAQYKWNQEYADTYKGTLIAGANVLAPQSTRIGSIGGKGFAFNPLNGVYIGRSTVYVSMQLAVYMGYRRIYIFGHDQSDAGTGKFYEWGSNPFVKDSERSRRFQREAESFTWASQNLIESIRKRFFFCSKWNPFPYIDKFNRLDEMISIPHILAGGEIV